MWLAALGEERDRKAAFWKRSLRPFAPLALHLAHVTMCAAAR